MTNTSIKEVTATNIDELRRNAAGKIFYKMKGDSEYADASEFSSEELKSALEHGDIELVFITNRLVDMLLEADSIVSQLLK